ncbi:MAG: hypothetical protein ACK50W_00855 [bacterium]|jgi:hypothetical protein
MINNKQGIRVNKGAAMGLAVVMLILLAPSQVALAEKKTVCTYTENNLRTDLLLLHSQLQQGSL